MEWWHNGTPTILGAATGAVAGLVAITPACGFVNPMNAMFIGMIVAMVCYTAVAIIKGKLGYDDSLDAFGVHGVGGTVGTIATGLFAEKAVNAAGANGLFFGNAHQLSGSMSDRFWSPVAFAAIHDLHHLTRLWMPSSA